MLPQHWGAGAWYLVFYLIQRHGGQRYLLISLLDTLVEYLPGEQCAEHAMRRMVEANLYGADTDAIRRFFVALYNEQHTRRMSPDASASEALAFVRAGSRRAN